MTEHIPAGNGTDQPRQAADTTADNPWPLSRLSDNLKRHIERVSPPGLKANLLNIVSAEATPG